VAIGSVSHDLTAAALHRLLRGRGWQALAREVTWAAVVATREPDAIGWLEPLVEQQLASRLAEVPRRIEEAISEARREYVRRWTGDAGIETAEELAAGEAAELGVQRAWDETVDWATALLLERRAAGERPSLIRRLRRAA
jgi:hypothetical protein